MIWKNYIDVVACSNYEVDKAESDFNIFFKHK